MLEDLKATTTGRLERAGALRRRCAAGLRRGLLSGGALLWAAPLLALPAQALAEAAAAPTALDEVVVTAQHRAENAQSTPIAIAVYNGEALQRAGITNIAGLAVVAPDVSLATSEGQSVITVRGISSRDTTENGDPAVTVNVDGFYMNRAYGLNANLYDIERIEVLRGPQGTLNGRNSVGGALNIVTSKPVDHFAAETSLEYGNYASLNLQGMVNVPLTDQVQVRAAFLSASHDGYRNNAPQKAGDGQDDKSARVQVAFEPISNLKGLLTAQYTSQDGTGDVLQYIPFIYTATGALNHGMPPGINSEKFPLGTQPFVRMRGYQFRGQLAYDVGGVEVTAIGGYDRTNYAQGVDQTLPGITKTAYQWNPTQKPNTYNAEIRVASKSEGPFQWQVGGFYFAERAHLRSGDVAPLPGGGYNEYFGFVYRTKQTSEAGYAQASYQLTPELKLTGGFRFTHDSKSESGYFGDLTGGVVYGGGAGSGSSSKATIHLAADYALTARNMVYAKYDTGYKAGGFNIGGSSYDPETVKGFEVGSKNRFFENTLQLNVAAYYYDYTKQQVATYAFLSSGQPVQLTQNAGASRIYGAEADLTYKLPAIGALDLSASYLHARYTDFLSIASPSDPKASGNVQLAGNRPPQAPTWSLGVGLEHTWDVLGGSLTGRIQAKAQSASYFSFYNFADTRQKAYAMSDAFVTYEPAEGRWKVSAFVRNLGDKVVFKDAEESQYAGAYGYEFFPPRTYGVRLEFSW
jgi:iron complex outermembrane receptor protein